MVVGGWWLVCVCSHAGEREDGRTRGRERMVRVRLSGIDNLTDNNLTYDIDDLTYR